MLSRKVRLWLATALLLLGFFVRAHQIVALPPFNDESLHIRRAEKVWSFADPDLSFTLGKLLTYYWYGLFGADRLDAIWVTRTATALFALLGLAATYAIARRLFGDWAGLLSLYFVIFAPFLTFFDRMALTDPITTALGMVTIWATLKMIDHPEKWERGILTGVFIALTIIAKLLGLPFAGVPILGVVAFGWRGSPRQLWQRFGATLLMCYLTVTVILLPFVLRIAYEELFGQRISVVDNHLINHQSPLDTLQANLTDLWEAVTVMNSLALTLLGLALGLFMLRWRPRPTILILGSLLAVWGFTIFASGVLSTRYLQLAAPLFFVILAGGLAVLGQKLLGNTPQAKWAWLPGWGVATLWIVLFAQPFALNTWNDPLALTVTDRARWEYYTNFTSGYGLMDAARVMPNLRPSSTSERVPVIGLAGSCHQIRLYLDEDGIVFLECPAFGWQGEFMPDVARYVEQRLAEEDELYMLVEPDLPYTDLSLLTVEHQLLGQFPRPFNGMRVELWRVYKE